MLLATFEVEKGGELCKFSVYGEITITERFELCGNNDISHSIPEYTSLSATRHIEGKEVPYTVDGTTWLGRNYDEWDMLDGMVFNLILGNDIYKPIYIHEELNTLINSYRMKEQMIKEFPRWILGKNGYSIYTLTLITDEWTYYNNDGAVLMLSTKEKEVVSDNYFAETGYFDSIKNIVAGKENKLWGDVILDDISSLAIHKLNSMCVSCCKLNVDCKGTTSQAWTGCIYRKERT